MSEGKRATLISSGFQRESDKKVKGVSKTVRICVVLPESNEDTCPEFNYKELVASEKKKVADVAPNDKAGVENGFGNSDDDDDVRRIAQEMEAKYGTVVGKKRKKGRRDDYADIGMGYDESDSFIDNTDGYDEIVPQNVTTLHGGFYINCGALEFKTVEGTNSSLLSSSSSDESSRKRALDSSDDFEEDGVQREKKAKLADRVQRQKKKQLFGHDKLLMQMKKKRTLSEHKRKSTTVKELLKEKRVDLDLTVPSDCSPDKERVPREASISDAIESVVKGEETEAKKKSEISSNCSKVLCSSEGESSRDGILAIVKLPENLSADIVEIIGQIKTAAMNNPDGKLKFFTSNVNNMLLNLERQCKRIGKQSRTKVYEHLAPFVRCKKEALMRRAKNLVLESEQERLKTLIKEVKDTVDRIMPGVLENYEQESQRIMLKNLTQEPADGKEKKPARLPHRRFPWTEDLKRTVRDITVAQKRCFLLEGKQKESVDTNLHEFMKRELQPLWPKGWISMSALGKVSGIVLETKKQTPQNSPVTTDGLDAFKRSSALSITPVVDRNKQQWNSSAKKLPEVEITKTLNPNVVVAQQQQQQQQQSESEEVARTKSVVVEQATVKDELIVLEDSPSPEAPRNLSEAITTATATNEKQQMHVVPKITVEDTNHCHVIDLTNNLNALSDMKRKPGPKSKTRFYSDGEKLRKAKQLDEITGSSALDQIITKTLGDHSSNAYAIKDTIIGVDYSNKRPTTSEGDDIQKVMEGLKNLQKMSSPVKTEVVTTSSASSPVSVIAYNKSYAAKTMSNSLPKTEFTKADFGVGFQEAFQKKFLPDFNFFKQGSSSAANNSAKYPHISNSGGPGLLQPGNKFVQGPMNNNFVPQNHLGRMGGGTPPPPPPQQPRGAYNKMLDDMFANFLSECGRQKPAAHKSKSQPK